jgi:hypothetical protein
MNHDNTNPAERPETLDQPTSARSSAQIPTQSPAASTSTPASSTGETAGVTANSAAELDEIVQPLIDLLNSLESDGCDDPNCYIVGTEHLERLQSRCPAVLIQLPQELCSEPWLLCPLERVLMALLARAGLESFCQPEDETDDFAGGPLRFRLIKHTHFEPEAEYFHSYMQLLVEANNLDVVAARRQIARLVKYLQDDAEVGSYDAEEFMRL